MSCLYIAKVKDKDSSAFLVSELDISPATIQNIKNSYNLTTIAKILNFTDQIKLPDNMFTETNYNDIAVYLPLI